MNGIFQFGPGHDIGQIVIGYASIGIVLLCIWRVVRGKPVFRVSRIAHPPTCTACGADRRQLHKDEACRECGSDE